MNLEYFTVSLNLFHNDVWLLQPKLYTVLPVVVIARTL